MVLQSGPGLVEQAVNEALGRGLIKGGLERRVIKASIVRSFSLSAFLEIILVLIPIQCYDSVFFARFFFPFTPVVTYPDHAPVSYLTFIHHLKVFTYTYRTWTTSFFPSFTPVVTYPDHAHVPYLTFIHHFHLHISDMDD